MGVLAAVWPPILERGTELGELREAVSDACAGAGRLVVIEGAAGTGKTRLLAAAAEDASARGLRVLRASGAELEREFAFGMVRQLFEPPVAAASPSVRRRLLAGAAAPAGWVLAPSGRVLAPSGEARPDSVFVTVHALYWLAANLAVRTPLLLAVDDLHWADEASAHSLAYLARRLADTPIAVVVTLRPGEPGAPAEAVDGLRAQPDAVTIVPRPLTRAAAGTVVRARVPEADDELCDAFYAASSGNPFYLQELLRAFAGGGLQSAGAVREASVPSLGDRVMRRIGRVAAAAPALAGAMAVVGDRAPLSLAAAVAGMDVLTASRLARSLVRIEVLAGEDPVVFVHPLIRRSVYDTLTRAERDAAHSAAAAQLAAAGAPAQEIAVHLAALRPARSERAAATLMAAAEESLSRADPETAIHWLRRALAEDAPAPSRELLLFRLGEAEMAVRDPAAEGHLHQALALTGDDDALRARVAAALAELLVATGRWDAGVEVVQSALDQIRDRQLELALELEAVRAATLVYDPRLAKAFQDDRRRLERLARGDAWPARALAALLAAAAMGDGDVRGVVRLAEHSLEGGRLLERNAGGWASAQVLHALVCVDELDWARAACEQVETAGRRSGSLVGTLTGGGYRGYIHARRGELADAEAVLRPLAEIAVQTGMDMWVVTGFFMLLDAMLERPSLNDVAKDVEAYELEPEFLATGSGALLLETRGRLRQRRGDHAGALADLRRCAETNAFAWPSPCHSPWRSELALALPAGADDDARALVDEELALARATGLARPTGVALRAAGLVRGGEDGVGLLRESVAVLSRCEASLERARSLVELGAALRRRSQRAQARGPLAEGMDLARRCGADRLVSRATDELRAAGARPRRAAVSGIDALTASELRVARLAALGQPNEAIAQELYVSRKTVETHLSHVYAKLGLVGQGARKSLWAALADRG
jgi:DNA-binding CsgD family transcriptional regulator